MTEIEQDFLTVDLSKIYAIEYVGKTKTKVYLGNAMFTVPMPYANIKQLVDIAKERASRQTVGV